MDDVSQEEPESLKKPNVDLNSQLEGWEYKTEQNLKQKFETYMAEMDEKIDFLNVDR